MILRSYCEGDHPMSKKKIPKFKSDDEERKFWNEQDSTQHIDWKQARRVTLPELKPSLKTISLRLPASMLEDLKLLAHKREIRKLLGTTSSKGTTLIPLAMYFVRGRVKLEIGVCTGKKQHDKREDVKSREADREMRRAMTRKRICRTAEQRESRTAEHSDVV